MTKPTENQFKDEVLLHGYGLGATFVSHFVGSASSVAEITLDLALARSLRLQKAKENLHFQQ